MDENKLPLNPDFSVLGVSFYSQGDQVWYHGLVAGEDNGAHTWWADVCGVVGHEPSLPASLKADLPDEIQLKVVAAVHEAAAPAWREFAAAIVKTPPPKSQVPRTPRMHKDLPPPGLEKVVIAQWGGVKPDAAKALAYMRETRDALDWAITDFEGKSNQAIAYIQDPDRTLVGETVATTYYMTAMANRLDLVIADMEKATNE